MIGGKLGARFRQDARTLKFSKYVDEQAIRWRRVPAARDFSAARDMNGAPISYDDDPLGNDRFGCCVYAGPGHYVNLHGQINGHNQRATEYTVLSAYSEDTGFDAVTGEGDNGAYVIDMLKRWKSRGLYGVEIQAYVSVDYRNESEVAQACELFGGVFVGFDLPETIEGQQVWDVTNPEAHIKGGHLVYQHGYSPGMDAGNSWGYRTPWTPAFRKRYMREMWAVLSPIALSGDIAPCGLRIDDLRADLRARGAL